MKRTLALLLMAALLLASCGSTEQPVETTAETEAVQTEAAETEITPALPEDLTFGGQDFNLLTSYYNDYCKINFTRDFCT